MATRWPKRPKLRWLEIVTLRVSHLFDVTVLSDKQTIWKTFCGQMIVPSPENYKRAEGSESLMCVKCRRTLSTFQRELQELQSWTDEELLSFEKRDLARDVASLEKTPSDFFEVEEPKDYGSPLDLSALSFNIFGSVLP
jgi:hypothetical protein